MATNHTTNYNLNLWEPTDAFVREEFNENTNKIEAAFFNHPSAELISSKSVDAEGMKYLELDTSQVNWNRYFMVIAAIEVETANHLYLQSGQGGYGTCVYTLSENVQTGVTYDGFAHSYCSNRLLSVIFSLYSGDTRPSVISIAGGQLSHVSYARNAICAGSCETSLKDITSLKVWKHGDVFSIGDKITLWGVK